MQKRQIDVSICFVVCTFDNNFHLLCYFQLIFSGERIEESRRAVKGCYLEHFPGE